MRIISVFILLSLFFSSGCNRPCPCNSLKNYLEINASASDPLYTTYTASPLRSRFYGDKGYKMNYYSGQEPLYYGSDKGGRIFAVWEINDVVVNKTDEYFKKPVVAYSFPDMSITLYKPWRDILVEESFVVYSSKVAFVDMIIHNQSGKKHSIDLYPVIEIPDSLAIVEYDTQNSAYILSHYETKKRLISNLYEHAPYPEHLNDYFTMDPTPYSYGGYKGEVKDFYDIIKTDFYADDRSDSLNLAHTGSIDYAALHYKCIIEPGEKKHIRYYRGIDDRSEPIHDLVTEIDEVKTIDVGELLAHNFNLYHNIPRIDFPSKQEKIVYISALNLVRGCILPPAGETTHNFYVFSREPLWGWGHGHQVLHESLSMMAYVYLDPLSAQQSQRVYMEQQGDNGLIAYRHGPRGMQDYPHYSRIHGDTMSSTSAPFYSWINWEIYSVSNDRQFLSDAYESGVKYTRWLLQNRDADRDGLYEWGPYGIIENVRDWYNAVFQVSAERYLDVDKEDISDELECLDLSLMIVNEIRHLSLMASELGMDEEAEEWNNKADTISQKINQIMWDEKSQFFYHVNRLDHSFYFMDRDLKRQEIIGFLPLWAQAVTKERADILIRTLTDTSKFWRRYGIPTLAADDEWYSPYVDYCCKWNGPVWLLWNYMIYDGLVKYGYDDLASELANKMMRAVTTQLSKNHNFWESYSPDNEVLNCPSNYIWDAIMAKILIEEYQ